MAATPYHGKTGNLLIAAAPILHLTGWSINVIGETAPSTAMGDTWEGALGGMYDFNGSADGLSKKALDTTGLIGDTGAFELVPGSNAVPEQPKITGTGILTGVTETVNYEAEGRLSYAFEGNDIDGLAWAATAGTAPSASADTFHGKTCKALAEAVNFDQIREWTLALTCGTADCSHAHATTWGRQRLPGFKGASATITCVYPGGAAPVIVPGLSTPALHLYRTATAADGHFTGIAFCQGYDLGTDKDGCPIITYKFLYSGAVTFAVV